MSKEEEKKPVEKFVNVCVAVPTMGEIATPLAVILINWARSMTGKLGFYFPFKVTPVERARNDAVRFFLTERIDKKTGQKLPDYTHILFVDADTIPDRNSLTKLLSHDKDIVSGLTPILKYNIEEKIWGTLDNCFTHQDKDENGKDRTHSVTRNTGLQKIWRCGTSCLLIKREVFEKLEKPYFKFELNEDGTIPTRSEDLYFCDKAREAGFEIYADTDVICNHLKDVML